jgi:hypothetical protein
MTEHTTGSDGRTGRPRVLIRSCACGYSPAKLSNLTKHQLICHVHNAAGQNKDALIATLEAQVVTKDQQLAAKDQQLAAKDQQLAAKDEQLQLLLKKPRAAPARKSLPEPKRRRIAAAQNWKCANPDGMCLLKGDLEEYDVDHRISLARGAQDDLLNMQALCPACHRRKTERDNRLLAEERRHQVDQEGEDS